ncbi:MAG TPA: DUF1887 family CARF protein [Candidatus Fermentibacter daniensis]|jgi:hypothetical protein|nr:DUF1887 family CARF protein [Candidatus Fermentibacter daniensis]
MKHYLLSWYGITDLRAALGLEPTDGPILSALKTKKYTDAVILAYTNPAKSCQDPTIIANTRWNRWKTSDPEARLHFPRDEAQQLVDDVSNTETGQGLFMDWLQSKLDACGVICNIVVIPKELKHLNDAQAIFDAAASAVKLTLEDDCEKTITTYISPGTPIMAYTWALIARAHPQHNIAVISSSEPRLPPETIDLPKGLLTPLVTGPQTAKPSDYDAIIHLLGRERMPIYFGMLQFEAPLHVFVTTQDYQHAGNVLSACLPKDCQGRTVLISDAFKPADTRRAIEKQLGKLPSTARVAVNLTGGTKLMFAGALAACWELGLEPFYFEINDHNIIFIRDGLTVPFIGARSVDDFFLVNGFDVITSGRWEQNPARSARLNVTRKLWEERKELVKLYQTSDFRNYISCMPYGKSRNPRFSWKWKNSQASFDERGEATLVLNGKAIPVPKCDDFGRYLGGEWLEEYVFFLLRAVEEKGLIYDVRIGMEVDYANRTKPLDKMPNGEFDCAFTDGKRLWLVECKAGNVKQEHIQKLENNLKTYGGIAARGILVSSFPITSRNAERIGSSTSITAVQSNELNSNTLERIITTEFSQSRKQLG